MGNEPDRRPDLEYPEVREIRADLEASLELTNIGEAGALLRVHLESLLKAADIPYEPARTLGKLVILKSLENWLKPELLYFVEDAREQDESWGAVARAMGMAHQSAISRFTEHGKADHLRRQNEFRFRHSH